jgi:hypothetical protein
MLVVPLLFLQLLFVIDRKLSRIDLHVTPQNRAEHTPGHPIQENGGAPSCVRLQILFELFHNPDPRSEPVRRQCGASAAPFGRLKAVTPADSNLYRTQAEQQIHAVPTTLHFGPRNCLTTVFPSNQISACESDISVAKLICPAIVNTSARRHFVHLG